MEITLKKASSLAKEALAAAAAIKIEPTISYPIHSTQDPEVVREAAAERIADNLGHIAALLVANMTIRKQIGQANAKCGINDDLTTKAFLDAHEKRLNALVLDTDNVVSSDVVAQANHIIKANLASAYSYQNDIKIQILSSIEIEALKIAIAKIRRERVKLQDQIAELNTTKITLDDNVVDVLRRHLIID